VTQSGHDGVHTFGEGLLGFSESFPTYTGGGASEQSFSSFLAGRPSQPIPQAGLIEVCQAVQTLVSSTLGQGG
jgi:hypothetical protein